MNITDDFNSTLSSELELSYELRMSLATMLGVMLVAGTFIKIRIIQYLLSKENSTKTNSIGPKIISIDNLILFQEAVTLLTALLILMQLIRILCPFMKEALGNIVFSSVLQNLACFTVMHRAIGGLGIAAVRVLCIKFHNCVIQIGPRRLVNCVCILTFSLSVIFSVGHTIEMAIVAPDILLNFFRDLRPPLSYQRVSYVSKAIFNRVVIITCLVFNLVEFICFAVLLFEIHKHHKRHVELCLSNKPDLAKKQGRQNAVTTVGHFTSWLVEIIIFGVIQYAYGITEEGEPFYTWIFCRVLLPSIDYVVFSSVQVMSSQQLRTNVFNLDCFKESCNSVKCKPEDDIEAAEEIELNDLPNGNVHHM